MLQVEIFTPGYVRLGVLPVLSGRVTLRRNAVSDFDLELDAGEVVWSRFDTDRRIVISEETGVPWEAPRPVLAGTVTGVDESMTAGVRTVRVAGVDDMVWLARRLTLPDPSRVPDQQVEDAYWKASGPAETVIRDLVDRNVGQGARPERRATLTVAPSGGGGSHVSVNTRYKNLLEEVQALALAGGVTMRTWQESGGSMFGFRPQRDLTAKIRLGDENEAVEDWKLTRQAPEVTTVIVAGQGEGAERQIVPRTGNANAWGVVAEEFRDRRDTDDPAELEQAGDERLEEGRERASATVTVVDLERMRFGEHFDLGDRVGVYLSGAVIEDTVQSAELQYSAQGRVTKLQVGPVLDEEDAPRWVDEVRRLRRDMRGLEGI